MQDMNRHYKNYSYVFLHNQYRRKTLN